jgi:hypothetical protein
LGFVKKLDHLKLARLKDGEFFLRPRGLPLPFSEEAVVTVDFAQQQVRWYFAARSKRCQYETHLLEQSQMHATQKYAFFGVHL